MQCGEDRGDIICSGSNKNWLTGGHLCNYCSIWTSMHYSVIQCNVIQWGGNKSRTQWTTKESRTSAWGGSIVSWNDGTITLLNGICHYWPSHVFQCKMSVNGQRGECWCVNPHTGRQIQTSPVVRGDPNCNQYINALEMEPPSAPQN